MKVVLHMTKSCNLRCRYCYAPAKLKESMTTEVAEKAIDLAVELGDTSACVSYFGGEPLLNWDAIEHLTRYAVAAGKRANKAMHFRLATNGTLFTDDILAFCRDHNVLYAVSLDGDQQAHDTMRVLADGSGSWHLIDRKLDTILKYNPNLVVTSVLTPGIVSRLRTSIEYMWSRGIRYFAHQLDYTNPDWTPEVFVELERAYNELADFYLEHARGDEHFHMTVFDEKLKTHAHSRIELGQVCDFGTRKISIAPDGRVFPCVQFISDKPDADTFCIGDVDNGLSARRDELVAENKRQRTQCAGCALQGRCANYCGCTNWQLTGRITEVPPILCAHEQMLIPIADRIGNELWGEQNAHFLEKHYRDYAERFLYSVD